MSAIKLMVLTDIKTVKQSHKMHHFQHNSNSMNKILSPNVSDFVNLLKFISLITLYYYFKL